MATYYQRRTAQTFQVIKLGLVESSQESVAKSLAQYSTVFVNGDRRVVGSKG